MILPVVEDISQLAKIRNLAQALESLATQVYLSDPPKQKKLAGMTYMHRVVIDDITKAFAKAYETIAQHGHLLTKAGQPVPAMPGAASDDCPPGWCPDGTSCHPCDGTTLFPSVIWPVSLPAVAAVVPAVGTPPLTDPGR